MRPAVVGPQSALLLAAMIAAGAGVAAHSRPTSPPAQPGEYTLQVAFSGLVSFVASADGRPVTARAADTDKLWVLLPDAITTKAIHDLKPRIRNFGKFAPGKNQDHAPHFPFLRVRAADLLGVAASGKHADAKVLLALGVRDPMSPARKGPVAYDLEIETPGLQAGRVSLQRFDLVPGVPDRQRWARACTGCLSDKEPHTVAGARIPLGVRMAFAHGEVAQAHPGLTDANVAEHVMVERSGIKGSTVIRLRKLGSQEEMHAFTLAPANGSVLHVEVVNLTAQELLGMPGPRMPDGAAQRPSEYHHFKLAYLLAPKPSKGAKPKYVWDYEDYQAPAVTDSIIRYDDAFCTPPSQLVP